MSNANKFTDRGTISLDARQGQESGRDWITISIADTFRWCCSVLEQQRNENGRVCSKGIKGRIWPGRIEEQLGNAAAVWKPPDVAAVAFVAVPKLRRDC